MENKEIKETEQWLLEGNCNKCRRDKYCSKPCKKSKIRRQRAISGFITNKMNEKTNGLYGYILREAFKNDR